ncbi:hypothetical protein [Ornithinimicrobium sp. INDO-MA30-4]|uniref:hypothetical protein n=1 Tax=Ornithinimicrobium sp. INDO-MA30-4 TaxID=2908651 RepID=UPI001F350360|nr:hypothetical protein [Ornithinimicrobium sp. INDO-MA30-4]UJH70000.1 hypothetical protein L0A91_12350 [Ornithinimicrobium sp. INDO-MA30-4]
MNQLTAPERRGMTSICTPEGQMLIVAADQRNGMKAVMNAPDGPSSISIEQLREAKRDMVRHLGNFAPAILLDPEVPLPHIVDEGILGRDTALVVGMDSSGFDVVDGLRFTKFVPGVTLARSATWAVPSPKCFGMHAPTNKTSTHGWPMRSANWSRPAPTKVCCSSSRS